MNKAIARLRMPSLILFVPDKLKPVESAFYLRTQVTRLEVVGLRAMFSEAVYQAIYAKSEFPLQRRMARETRLMAKGLVSEVFCIGERVNEEGAYLLREAFQYEIPIVNCTKYGSTAHRFVDMFQPLSMRHWYDTYRLGST